VVADLVCGLPNFVKDYKSDGKLWCEPISRRLLHHFQKNKDPLALVLSELTLRVRPGTAGWLGIVMRGRSSGDGVLCRSHHSWGWYSLSTSVGNGSVLSGSWAGWVVYVLSPSALWLAGPSILLVTAHSSGLTAPSHKLQAWNEVGAATLYLFAHYKSRKPYNSLLSERSNSSRVCSIPGRILIPMPPRLRTANQAPLSGVGEGLGTHSQHGATNALGHPYLLRLPIGPLLPRFGPFLQHLLDGPLYLLRQAPDAVAMSTLPSSPLPSGCFAILCVAAVGAGGDCLAVENGLDDNSLRRSGVRMLGVVGRYVCKLGNGWVTRTSCRTRWSGYRRGTYCLSGWSWRPGSVSPGPFVVLGRRYHPLSKCLDSGCSWWYL
jgi:hypothetical protein